MKKLTNKELSVKHENYIAEIYNGVRSKSSGASAHDDGDVRTARELMECKATMSTMPVKLEKELMKIYFEALREGRVPVLCARYYDPNNELADYDGWVDLTIRLTRDDKMRHYGS